MSEQELTETINRAVHDAIKTELGAYKVDKEQHYKDHMFLSELREWYTGIRNATVKTIVGAVIMAALSLLFLGFIVWGKATLR